MSGVCLTVISSVECMLLRSGHFMMAVQILEIRTKIKFFTHKCKNKLSDARKEIVLLHDFKDTKMNLGDIPQGEGFELLAQNNVTWITLGCKSRAVLCLWRVCGCIADLHGHER